MQVVKPSSSQSSRHAPLNGRCCAAQATTVRSSSTKTNSRVSFLEIGETSTQRENGHCHELKMKIVELIGDPSNSRYSIEELRDIGRKCLVETSMESTLPVVLEVTVAQTRNANGIG